MCKVRDLVMAQNEQGIYSYYKVWFLGSMKAVPTMLQILFMISF